jgi:hypothetical protein
VESSGEGWEEVWEKVRTPEWNIPKLSPFHPASAYSASGTFHLNPDLQDLEPASWHLLSGNRWETPTDPGPKLPDAPFADSVDSVDEVRI